MKQVKSMKPSGQCWARQSHKLCGGVAIVDKTMTHLFLLISTSINTMELLSHKSTDRVVKRASGLAKCPRRSVSSLQKNEE